jgi:predicted HicB family RNase H-like nuclease
MKNNSKKTMTLRLTGRTHHEMKAEAKKLGMSLNAFICHLIELYRRDDASQKRGGK